jgi:RsiW-degrading membrane proteinase PrsW (M82 family)
MSHSTPLHFQRFATVGYLVHNGVGTHQCASCMLQRLSHQPASHATITLIAEARTRQQAASQDQHKHDADSTGSTVPTHRTACFIYCLTGTQLLLVVLPGAFQVVHLLGRQQ